MKTRRSIRNQDRVYRSIGRELQAQADLRKRLFSCVRATGISYCDTTQEEHGDYRQVAFLPFRSMQLEIVAVGHPLIPIVRQDAAQIIARRGEQYQVSTVGQTVTLGE